MQALSMTDAELAAWLALAAARGLPPATLRKLLAEFGAPEALRAQPFAALARAASENAARAILAEPEEGFEQRLAITRAWLEVPGNAIVTLSDPAYPAMLLATHDPPPLLYVRGRLALLHAPSVAIVGSRSATPQGLEDAGHFARTLADAGLTIVSGLALGIDAAAHRGALNAHAGTLAVIGTGADLVYPAKHRALAHEIAACGAIVSEWPLGTPARPAHFPQRNRLIAGLARGVLIIEAALRSGSLITARLANEAGRDVFAVPGSIHAPLARGCHQLIKEGAKLTETPADVLEEFGIAQPAAPPEPATGTQGEGESEARMPLGASVDKPSRLASGPTSHRVSTRELEPAAERLLAALGHAPATLEVLAERTEMDSASLQGVLLSLELAGHLTTLPGGRFARIARH
ncbi:DNA-protecting protein DprA [Trinickia fusca]|uniref:DNA-protecting protein DprA n=2 Tax=Trinickia fusca TaxID=2419777 RepID=A0A494XN72_9BURK|nr:DNA-processing protein DprA [Trinickia fusca]RKP49559.1 DNA-protecting protein DprA [Trinickia fusca]